MALLLLAGCQTPYPLKMDIRVHGHRGSRGTHPDNTIPAFKEAIDAGAMVIELDLQLTRDDVLVVFHEPVLSPHDCRYRDGRSLVSSISIHALSAAELATYDCASLPPKAFPQQKPIPGTRIPTFSQVLAFVAKETPPSTQMNIETKMSPDLEGHIPDPATFVRMIIRALDDAGLRKRAILQSFDPRTLEAARDLAPDLRTSYLTNRERYFCIVSRRLGVTYASPDFALITRAEVARCHEWGILVAPWTVNDKADWQRMQAADVDDIITDYPRLLMSYLRESK